MIQYRHQQGIALPHLTLLLLPSLLVPLRCLKTTPALVAPNVQIFVEVTRLLVLSTQLASTLTNPTSYYRVAGLTLQQTAGYPSSNQIYITIAERCLPPSTGVLKRPSV